MSRTLGRTGFAPSALGIGDLADRTAPESALVATLRRAIGHGLNVIDTAPGYEDGLSERLVGRAVAGRRDGMFLIDKVDALDAPVRPQVESSLVRLGLEAADLFVFHDVSALPVWRALSAPGGGLDQLGACVREGLARFRGISSHDPDVLAEAIAGGACDVVMFAVGPFADPRYEAEILPLARRHGVGTVCFKTFGAGKLLGETSGYGRPLPDGARATAPPLTVDECLRYTLTAGPDVALLGLSTPEEQDAAFSAAASFRPLEPREMEGVRRRAAAAVAGKGRCWWNPAPG